MRRSLLNIFGEVIKQKDYLKLSKVSNNISIIDKKNYASDLDLLNHLKNKPIKRVSLYDKKTDDFILCVRDNNFTKAELLVKQGLSVDSHNIGENTALTDAAERGDCKAIRFLIQKLGANPHASCDCPYHKTALHYAVENGHYSAVELLLSLGANPLVLDSRNYRPIDVSTNKNIKILLENNMKKSSNSINLKFLNGI